MGEVAHIVRATDESRVCTAAVRGALDGIAVLAADGRFAFVNAALADALGVAAATLVGQPLAAFAVGPGSDDGVAAALATARSAGHWRGELRRPGTDPTPTVWDVALTPIDDGRTAAVFRDVSEKHAVEQLRADFLSMLVHDIKAPLTVILGYVELLGDPPGSLAMLEETLPRIRESGELIHGLVCNFLDLSRIEAGRLRLDPRPVDLDELVREAVEQHLERAQRKHLTLTWAPGGLPALSADAQQLDRVIANLLGNAIKYTPAGGTVVVSTARLNGSAAIVVKDTGPGIPTELLPHLFEKYRRARESRRVEGTGLGLFIAKTIAEAHGGRIMVDTAPGAGSTFTVLLPIG
jgi:signal transduction histidine kinase